MSTAAVASVRRSYQLRLAAKAADAAERRHEAECALSDTRDALRVEAAQARSERGRTGELVRALHEDAEAARLAARHPRLRAFLDSAADHRRREQRSANARRKRATRRAPISSLQLGGGGGGGGGRRRGKKRRASIGSAAGPAIGAAKLAGRVRSFKLNEGASLGKAPPGFQRSGAGGPPAPPAVRQARGFLHDNCDLGNIRALFAAVDVDGDEHITRDEFRVFMDGVAERSGTEPVPGAALRETFGFIDTDGSGRVLRVLARPRGMVCATPGLFLDDRTTHGSTRAVPEPS